MTHPDTLSIQKHGELPRPPRKGKTLICGWCAEMRLFEGSGKWYLWHGGYVVCEKCVADYAADFFGQFWREA